MKDYFDEIIGYEDIKKELRIISDMLNNPEVYRELGAELNDGLVLFGEPGTGKTTMANCLIQSTGRNAFVCRKKSSDGEFLKTISDTFEEAKRQTPSIVLLDDLDKFSDMSNKSKHSNSKEEHDTEEFVTVQSCMDEIKDLDVFVIATVNEIKKLPDSLLRAGRFGKKLTIRLPEQDEAKIIVDHYLKKTNICDEIDAEPVARMLYGESCATLESVINNAAIKAAYNRQEKVSMQNIVDSCLDLVFHAPERSKKLSEGFLKMIAYHEAGHAIVSELLDPGSVSILSIRETNGGSYGFVRYCRPDENEDCSAEYNEIMIKVSLAGRAATEMVFGETDMGANGDLHNAFDKAEYLVDNQCMYGFQNWIQDWNTACADENRNRTIAMVMEKNYLEVKKLLAEHRVLLDKMAVEALSKTTLVLTDIQRIMSENTARQYRRRTMMAYSFDNYKVDINNAQAYKMAKGMVENLEESANLLYIYGKSGTGKTHILYAIEKFIRENNPELNVVRISTVDFVNDVIDVIRTGNNGKMKELRNFYQKADVLLVDDIDFLVNKESSSEEFIHIFNKVYEAEKKIVITGELSPSELKNRGLSEKLKSRLEWGCVAEILEMEE